jgi:hypothetical protein
VLNGAADITVTDPATVAQAAIIEAAANSGATTYDLSDSAENLETADAAVLALATAIDAAGDADVTLTGSKVTDGIIAKFDASDDLTLNASGAQLSALSAATLADADVVAINASDATLAELAVIQSAATATVSYSLADSGANLAGASMAVLNGATGIDATDDAVTFYDNGVGDAEITGAIIAKFDSSDRLTLNAEDGATFEALSAATLGDPRVYVLDAYDSQPITLTDEQVTNAIVRKFDPSETLTLNAAGETLSALSAETLRDGNPSLILNATNDAITLR